MLIMNILLDTHIALWMLRDANLVPVRALELVANPQNDLYVSTVALWEVSLKHMKNSKAMPVSGTLFREKAEEAGFRIIGLEASHIEALETLDCQRADEQHKDPFDRILIAQSKAEGMLLLTHDERLDLYGEPLVCVV